MSGERILVVDDRAPNLKLARVLLEREGYEVKTATDAETAQQLIPSFEPRLILMDIRLPGMDGLELTRRLKADATTKDVLVVALSANVMNGDEERARAAGCDGYVEKPIEIVSLLQTVAELLATRPVSP